MSIKKFLPYSFSKTVTAAATAESLLADSDNQKLGYAVVLRGLSTNTGNVYIGDSTVDNTTVLKIVANQELEIIVPDSGGRKENAVDLTRLYIDVDTSGEGVEVEYLAIDTVVE